ncbi:hypothetical protein A2U01_0103440, partial [Trifolium medium]|nr:hypothetical protein [Trifolium medium]
EFTTSSTSSPSLSRRGGTPPMTFIPKNHGSPAARRTGKTTYNGHLRRINRSC